jgi:hypothetical protein
MKIGHILFLFLVLIACCFSCSRAPTKVPVTSSRFQAGQVWTFHTPTNDVPGATLSVIRVDSDSEEGPIINVWVKGVMQHVPSTYNFMAFSEDALNRSVIALVGTNAPLAGEDLQTFQQVYEFARQGVEKGELDKSFKITVAEVLKKSREPAKQPWWRFW